MTSSVYSRATTYNIRREETMSQADSNVNYGRVSDAFDKVSYLGLIDAYRVRLHPVVTGLLVISYAIQALLLVPSFRLPWGPVFTYIFRYTQEHATLGLEYLSYNVLAPLLATLLAVQLVTLCLYGFGFYLQNKGNERFETVKKIVVTMLIVFSIFPFAPVTLANQFLLCDPKTNLLITYTDVTCATIPNIIWIVIACGLIFTHTILFALFTYYTCNFSPKGRFNFFSMEEMYFILWEQCSLLILFATYNLPITTLPWWPGATILVQAFFTLIFLLRSIPFHTRSTNSLYCGFITARLFGSIPLIIVGSTNPKNSIEIGSGLGAAFIVLAVIGFFLGFLAMEIFLRIAQKQVFTYLSIFIDGKDPKTVKLFLMKNILRICIKNTTLRDHMEKTVKIAASFAIESSEMYLMLATSYVHADSVSQGQLYLQRAMSSRPSYLTLFSILQRSKDIDEMIGDGKLITKLIDRGETIKAEMMKYTRLFFKQLVASEIDLAAADKFAIHAAKYEYDCDRLFNNLINRFPKNANVNRIYGRYLEEVKNDAEGAIQHYIDADSIEEQDQERLKMKNSAMHDVNKELHPEIEEELVYPSSKRAVIPYHIAKEPSESRQLLHGSPTKKHVKGGSVVEHSPIEQGDSSSSGVSDKVRSKFLTQLYTKDARVWTRVALYAIAPVLCVVIIIFASVIETQIPFVDTDTLLTSCHSQPIAFRVLNEWRIIQRNGANVSELQHQFASVRDSALYMRNTIQNTKLKPTSYRAQLLYDGDKHPRLLSIPSVTKGQVVPTYHVENFTGYDVVTTVEKTAANGITISADAVTKPTSQPTFLFFWENRENILHFYEDYCDAFTAEFYAVDKDRTTTMLVIIAVGVIIHLLYFGGIFTPGLFFLFRSRQRILGLYKFLPKEVVGALYRKLKKMNKDQDSNKSTSIPKNVLPHKAKIILVAGSILLVEAICLGLMAYISYRMITCDKDAADIILHFSELTERFHRVSFYFNEIFYPDPNLDFPGISYERIKGTTYSQNLRGLIQESLDSLKESWSMVQFGYGSKTGQGLDGFNSEIDNILHGKECDDVNDLNCLNVDDLMVMLDYHVNTIYDNYKNFTAEEKLAAMNQTFALTNTADDKTLKAVFLYSEIAYTNCKLPFPSAIIYVLTCIGLLALLIPFHMVIQAYIDSNHKLRTMFGMFTNEQIDAVPQIREYVYSYVLPSLVTTNKRAQDASTSVISIEAFMDGALLCNTQGVVTEINNAAKDIFGFNSSDIIGRHIRDAFTVSTGSDLESVLSDALKMSKGFTREYDALKKNGTKFPARVSVMTTKSGTQTLLVVFIADLTVQQKQKELLAIEKSKNEQLLLSILPASVALRLKRGDTNISESFDSVTCFFSDMVGFTSLSGKMSASELVEMLNNVVNRFDDLCKEHHLEKIKTIGDAYFCVGGLVPGDTDHAANCVRFAMAAIRAVTNEVGGGKINIRVGIHTGPIIAGVIGKSKFAFDCWGDTVNLASRMESTGLPGRIQVSRSTYERVHDLFEFEERYDIEVKGKGTMTTYVLKYEVEKVDIEEEYREEIEEEPSP